MNKTKIEWVKNPDGTQGYTWNPITGCLNGCEYCYARRLANGRLRQIYLGGNCIPAPYESNSQVILDPFYPRFWPKRLYLDWSGTPKGIFVCDMGELFGDWIPQEWQEDIFRIIRLHNEHRFYLLTKQPQNLINWSPFSPNCWVGVTATGVEQYKQALAGLAVIKATVKYISFEPLLEHIPIRNSYDFGEDINWLVIGACTGTKYELLELCQRWNIENKYRELRMMPYGKRWTLQPKIEWVEEIVEAADEAGIPVFLKNNLKPLILSHIKDKDARWADILLDAGGNLRQDMPKGDENENSNLH